MCLLKLGFHFLKWLLNVGLIDHIFKHLILFIDQLSFQIHNEWDGSIGNFLQNTLHNSTIVNMIESESWSHVEENCFIVVDFKW